MCARTLVRCGGAQLAGEETAAGGGRTDLSKLPDSARTRLFDLFASQLSESAYLRRPEGCAAVRGLPIFRTAAGPFVALDSGPNFATCPPESAAFVRSPLQPKEPRRGGRLGP